AECSLLARKLLTLAPDELASSYEGMVDSAAQRLPANGCVDAVELSDEIARLGGGAIIVASRVGKTEIQVGGFGQIAVCAQVLNRAHIAFLLSLKNIRGIAAEQLSGGFEEDSLRGG